MVATAKLKTPITIESLAEGYDEIGQPLSTWEVIHSCFAGIRQLNGYEALKAQTTISITKASVLIRFKPGIYPGSRVVTPDGTMNVEAVLPNRAGNSMTLICERVQ